MNQKNMENLTLTKEWDKTFPKSDKVDHCKVTFVNRYGITLAADMYKPKDAVGRLAAIAVCGPFGAVKEQAAGLYAQEMAERGFLTIAFYPSFTGESGGSPRYMTSPDINTEDFSAAVDYLVTHPEADPEKIGIIGICGWGGIALSAASADPRIKATLASTMYDMNPTAISIQTITLKHATQSAKSWRLSEPKITVTEPLNPAVVSPMYCPRMRPAFSVTIMTTTRHPAVIIRALLIQTEDVM